MNPQVTLGMTVSPEKISLTLADGESREASMCPDGSYRCPFCSAAVISPEGWEANEANNARIYAAQGDAYDVQPYSRWQRATWEARGCGNPMCLVSMNLTQLAERSKRIAAREAEALHRRALDESTWRWGA